MKFGTIVLSIAVALISSRPLSSCECVGRGATGAEAKRAYDAVFLGQVTDIRLISLNKPVRENEYHYDDEVEVAFSVRRAWKGVDQPVVHVITPLQATACGDMFRVGYYYFVYAQSRVAGGPLEVNRCTPTKELHESPWEADALGKPSFSTEGPQSR